MDRHLRYFFLLLGVSSSVLSSSSPDGSWYDIAWSAWSECDTSRGSGIQYRTAPCPQNDVPSRCSMTEHRTCEEKCTGLCGAAKSEIVCEGGTLNITCPTGQKLKIVNANFGRTKSDSVVCPFTRKHKDDTNCISDTSKHTIKGLCQDEDSCIVDVAGSLFGDDPCPGTYKYLQVEYQCCNDDIDECAAAENPCNGGVCVNTDGSFTCNCEGTGYEGDTCDVATNCSLQGNNLIDRQNLDTDTYYTMVERLRSFDLPTTIKSVKVYVQALRSFKIGLFAKASATACHYQLKAQTEWLTPSTTGVVEFDLSSYNMQAIGGDHLGFSWQQQGVFPYTDSGELTAGKLCGEKRLLNIGDSVALANTFSRVYSYAVETCGRGNIVEDEYATNCSLQGNNLIDRQKMDKDTYYTMVERLRSFDLPATIKSVKVYVRALRSFKIGLFAKASPTACHYKLKAQTKWLTPSTTGVVEFDLSSYNMQAIGGDHLGFSWQQKGVFPYTDSGELTAGKLCGQNRLLNIGDFVALAHTFNRVYSYAVETCGRGSIVEES